MKHPFDLLYGNQSDFVFMCDSYTHNRCHWMESSLDSTTMRVDEQLIKWAVSSPLRRLNNSFIFSFLKHKHTSSLRCWLARGIRKQCTEGRLLLTIVQLLVCTLFSAPPIDWLTTAVGFETLADYLKYCAILSSHNKQVTGKMLEMFVLHPSGVQGRSMDQWMPVKLARMTYCIL